MRRHPHQVSRQSHQDVLQNKQACVRDRTSTFEDSVCSAPSTAVCMPDSLFASVSAAALSPLTLSPPLPVLTSPLRTSRSPLRISPSPLALSASAAELFTLPRNLTVRTSFDLAMRLIEKDEVADWSFCTRFDVLSCSAMFESAPEVYLMMSSRLIPAGRSCASVSMSSSARTTPQLSAFSANSHVLHTFCTSPAA
eukprot:6210121-Pleurochrysis_carterae.AAC.1